MNKKALINVDYTNDFVDGSLPVGPPAEEIEEKIVSITKEFLAEGDYVVLAIDLHHKQDAYHPETKLFPPHNIEGSNGRTLYGQLQEVYEKYKEDDNLYYMDKMRYSAFAGTDLDIKLRERGITEVHIIGVCTDICVLHTAVDAYNKGYNIVIHKEAVASFNQQGHEWALGHFAACLGAKVL
ncbi:isochorismatase family cysteine hydrolase [Bacillus sp. FJAT-52991]|uniref:Isochorismatase family cysteine hydrolase n=1 Tax=Bacillus kandeliae TaxID=3129297 RepID=A0ABZ2N8V5_9BACI